MALTEPVEKKSMSFPIVAGRIIVTELEMTSWGISSFTGLYTKLTYQYYGLGELTVLGFSELD
jgi:hypothetical protein